jgi:hypothetical protein
MNTGKPFISAFCCFLLTENFQKRVSVSNRKVFESGSDIVTLEVMRGRTFYRQTVSHQIKLRSALIADTEKIAAKNGIGRGGKIFDRLYGHGT